MTFTEKLIQASKRADSLVCVGLDTDLKRIPTHIGEDADAVLAFNRAIIEATSDSVCAYKPNSAFYEAMGSEGIDVLIKTVDMIPDDVPVILDVKRGDIGNTAEQYAAFAYDVVGADAVTVNPYMGYDAVKPFIRENTGIFVLCLTSNASSTDFQFADTGDGPLFELVAKRAAEWADRGCIGLVTGATQPAHLGRIREIAGEMPFLVPGVGAQGGGVGPVIDACGGEAGMTVINSSRGIIFASDGEDFAEAARQSLDSLNGEINAVRRAGS